VILIEQLLWTRFSITIESDHYVFTRHWAGISLLIAALSAKGTSTIQNIEQIDRGYERIDERLRAIGLILFVLGKKT
jgi:UDP-N-acetylglucosamine enolpyruvyl transferase